MKEKEDYIWSILHKQATIHLFQGNVDEARSDLAEALKTQTLLEEAESSHHSPAEKVLFGTASAAFSFGVVTEAFGDLASLTAVKSDFIGRRVSLFQKNAEIRRLMEQQGLCGNPGLKAPLIKASALPFLIGGAGVASTLGLIELTQSLGEDDLAELAAAAAEDPEVSAPVKSYSEKQLRDMSVDDLKHIEEELSGRMSKIGKAQGEVGEELKKVRTALIVLNMGETGKENLEGIQDPELQALARKVIAQGSAHEGKSFLEDLGVYDLAGIGLGFGIGTKVLHGMYDGLAPWRPFLQSGMNSLSLQARAEAAAEVERLLAQGVLKPCQAEKSETTEKAPANQESGSSNLVPLSEFTEVDYQNYLEMWVPADMTEMADWKSVPLGLVSFLSPFNYKESPKEDRWKWNELLENAATLLSERYAMGDEEEASIREAVGRFAAAYRSRTAGSDTRSPTDVNLMKWQMQWYVSQLEQGVVPTKEEVQDVLDVTATGRIESGVVATYFTIQERAQNYVSLLAKGDGKITFETAAEMHWRRLDDIAAKDAAMEEAKARMERDGYRRATNQDLWKRLGETYFPSQQDALRAAFEPMHDGADAPLRTPDGKEVYVKDGDWYVIGPANDNAVAAEDEAAFVPVAPMMMPVPLPAAVPAAGPAFAL